MAAAVAREPQWLFEHRQVSNAGAMLAGAAYNGAHAANGGNNKKDSFAVKQTDCSSEAFQTSMTSFPSGEDYLAFSGNTVVHETGADGDTNGGLTSLSGSCASRPFTFKSSTSSPFQQVDRAKLDYKTINAGSLDPRPTGMACSTSSAAMAIAA